MSSPRAAKRRKPNGISNGLSKPFVSPLKTVPNGASGPLKTTPQGPGGPANRIYTPSILAHSTITADLTHPTAHSPAAASGQTPLTRSTPTRQPRPWPRLATAAPRPNPAEAAAQRANAALEREIREARADISTLAQAARLAAGAERGRELDVLAERWRQVARRAAEELFGPVKERVCRMGGVGAWRAAERRKSERGGAWMGDEEDEGEKEEEEGCEFDSQGEELPEDEREARREEVRRVRREAREAAEPVESHEDEDADGSGDARARVWQEEGGDDDTFTMDMMLRSLNIDLEVIGYDKLEQRWMASDP